MAASVHLARSRDLDAIEKIENDADRLLINELQPDDWATAPTGVARASEPGFILVVELDDGRVAGFVHVLEVDGICHLEQLSVAPRYARKGWGRALVEAAKVQAQKRGYHRISLRTFADIPWNAPFYASAGFAEEKPATQFHRSLVGIETELGLDRYARRVQMGAHLKTPGQ
ncbi:GNAT family N-acetyltransferase [Cryobacterium frigoriphilum]|uniref:GNAT family N-acetyltransferase n=1 Tax=Cryobacterium frigoriphilum TaxID=1259150 RepID=A0A4R9A4Q2_9MICO|nr:GNAT family N-acetyltransferase [Cryobacterium frigoriphilum]TFD52167.1 GNAT family N-acetyltransferase [Cryobacterium frigoriphilum]